MQLREYIKEIFTAAWEKALEGSAWIEVILCLGIFFLPKLFKAPKPPDKNNKSLRRIFIWKALTEDKWRAAVLVILLFVVHFLLIAPYQVYKNAKNSQELKHDPPYETVAGQLASSKIDLTNATLRAEQAENKSLELFGLLSQALSGTNARPISESINAYLAQLDLVWQQRSDADHNNAKLRAQHARDHSSLVRLSQEAETSEQSQHILAINYGIWVLAITEFKKMLLEQATVVGAVVHSDPLPSISDIIKKEPISVFITMRTNSEWSCRCEFNAGSLNLDCNGRYKTRSVFSIVASETTLSIKLTTRDLNSKVGEDITLLDTNCPVASPKDCVGALDYGLNLLIEDQSEQF